MIYELRPHLCVIAGIAAKHYSLSNSNIFPLLLIACGVYLFYVRKSHRTEVKKAKAKMPAPPRSIFSASHTAAIRHR